MYSTLTDVAGLKGITVAHINIRSVFGKLEEIIRILHTGDIDVLCITETWLNRYVNDAMLSIDGYNMIRADRSANSGKQTGGGIMVYYKNDLDVTVMDGFTLCNPHAEVLWVNLQLKQTRPQYIGVIYRPPDGDYNALVDILEDHLTNLNVRNNDRMLIGDINVDLLKSREPKTRSYIDFYKRQGLTSLIKGITHHGPLYESCIDHLCVNRPEMFEQHGIIDLNASDHNLVFAARKQPKIVKEFKYVWCRSFRRFEPTLFERDVLFADWREVMTTTDCNLAWDSLVHKLNSILDTHAPHMNVRIPESMPKWVTKEFLQACDERDFHLRQYRRHKNDNTRARMKQSRNHVTWLKNQLKKDYFARTIRDAKGNSKKLWGKINEAFGRSTKGNTITEINGKCEPEEIAGEINRYFTGVAAQLSENFGNEMPQQTEKVLHHPKLHLKTVDVALVKKLILGLSLSTAVGEDSISPRVLRAAIEPLSVIITRIINLSIVTGICPDAWKIAKVTPIFKDGDRSDPGNYRPISVLPTVSKVMERIIHSQLADYLDKYSVLSNNQHGFRKHHSTETCCLAMLDKMYKAMDEGKVGGVVFLDLKKAFDTVNHPILLRKLSAIGVSDESNVWFKSYLENRSQKTKIGNCLSDSNTITHGVPQGSILGPLLFLIYINDLCDVVELCGTSMYADDTAVFYLGSDVEEVRLCMQHDMQAISYWMYQNRLSLNVKKTKLMMIGSRQRLRNVPTFNLSLNGQRIDTVTRFKYLGLVLDPHLCFNMHIDSVVEKSTTKLGILYKTRWLFDLSTARMLYSALILPHFDLGNTVYCVATQHNLARLQIIQNAAARLILLADARCPIFELHERLKWDTLSTRATKALVRITYCCLHTCQPGYLFDCLKPVEHRGLRTRATESNSLNVPRVQTALGANAFEYRASAQWNQTKISIKAAVNLNQLKRLFKTDWYR